MKLFSCRKCGLLLFFENTTCGNCGARLGYLPATASLLALQPDGDGWRPIGGGDAYHFCGNAEHQTCNWLIPADSNEHLCRACRYNRTIPDLSVPANLLGWRKVELAKHRLFYSLLRLRLPLQSRDDDPEHGLAFDFLAPEPDKGGTIVTGHADGLITVDITEADDARREQARGELGERYRTLLGHLRHEIGHYYWQVLVERGGQLDAFRTLFGDERADYGEALSAHYARGPDPDWPERFISAYAGAHPWEDFAETWAHYLHIVDTLETAHAHGIRLQPRIEPSLQAAIDFDPYDGADFESLIAAWTPLTLAVNSLNRSMGQPDLYPFVMPAAAIEKLRFVHGLICPA